MKKNLQERYGRYDARFPMNEVYLSMPRAVRNDAYLYLLALSGHQRANEADENVPLTIAEAIAQSMGVKAERMISALESVKKDGQPRVLARVPGHLRLVKYAKWQDLPDEIAELKAKRSEAGKVGGLNSAKARATQASGEANAQARAQASAQALDEQPLQQVVKQTQPEREIEIEGENERGDTAHVGANGTTTSPSPQVQVLRLLDWFMAKRGWSSWESPDVQRREAQQAVAIIELGLPFTHLIAALDLMWSGTDPDDRPSSLKYFWTRLQDQHHASSKQQRSLASSELTKVQPTMPSKAART